MYLGKTKSIKIIQMLVCVMCVFTAAAMLHTEPAFAVSADTFKSSKVTIAAASSVNYKTIKVSWSKLSGSAGYEVWAAEKKSGNYKKVGTASGVSTLSLNVGKRVTGKKYFFKVRAFMKSGGSTVYSKYSAVKAGKAKPVRPEVTLTVFTKTKVKVSYKKVAGASGYEIRRASKQTGTYKKIKTITSGKTLKYTDKSAVMSDNKCFYKVRAFRKSGGKKVYGPYSTVTIAYAGNARQYDISKITAGTGLADLDIVFLGSSVTLGKESGEQSFVDVLMKQDGVSGGLAMKDKRKFTVNGTTLTYTDDTSYVSRLTGEITDAVAPEEEIDYLVCQLSTNDAREKYNVTIGTSILGPIEDLSKYDQTTVKGAIEYIAGYTAAYFGCPTIFYVVPEYESSIFDDEKYQKMREALHTVKLVWDGHDRDEQGNVLNEEDDQILILDMWTDPTYNAAFQTAFVKKRSFWMADAVHPTKAGYVCKFTPAFEKMLNQLIDQTVQDEMDPAEYLEEMLPGEAVPATDTGDVQEETQVDNQENVQEDNQEDIVDENPAAGESPGSGANAEGFQLFSVDIRTVLQQPDQASGF